MKKLLLTGSVVCSITLAVCTSVYGHNVTWKYSEDNMENTYAGKWVNSTAGFQLYLPGEGWDEYFPQSTLAVETESEGSPGALDAETEGESPAGIETETEAEAVVRTETESDFGSETAAETGLDTETETETETGTEYSISVGISEYSLIQPEDRIMIHLYHMEREEEGYPSIDDIFDMFHDATNQYLVECNGIQAVHFDRDNTENIAFPEIVGDEESGFAGSVAVLTVCCDSREDRELFADELFSSVKMNSEDSSLYLVDGRICSEKYNNWKVQQAADSYIRMLTHKKFISNVDEDEPGLAEGFAVMDLDNDGLMELLVQYIGYSPSAKKTVTDYALYTFSNGEEKLLLTTEGLGRSDEFYFFPRMRLLEYDTYTYDNEGERISSYDCYQYNGEEVIHSDYDDVDWSQNGDMLALIAEDFIIPNTEENRQTISERMQENMAEYKGENLL